jgi:hypothetical protein
MIYRKKEITVAIDHSIKKDDAELLYFWAVGDLHFWTEWSNIHAQRLQTLFQDLDKVWGERLPAFCAFPGDLIERGTAKNYALAKAELTQNLHAIPIYPGLGNHEYYPGDDDVAPQLPEDFTRAWEKPTKYFWEMNGVLFVMLDQPNPMLPEARVDNPVYLAEETLDFLQATLNQHPEHPAIIFVHCPLHNTVLDRNPAQNLDYDSLESFFYVENSDKVRAILAQHPQSSLYINGHTHSGWQASNLVSTEILGGHPVTFVNLMSPWYTGRRGGGRFDRDTAQWKYQTDEPDVQASFAFHVYRDRVVIRAREHLSQRWLAEWTVPVSVPSTVGHE